MMFLRGEGVDTAMRTMSLKPIYFILVKVQCDL